MADKTLNAVPTASNGAFIYAEDANGNQIKISKADLASVVAELIGEVSLRNSGLMPAGLYVKYSNTIYVDPGETYNLGSTVNGFVLIRNSYSWGGYMLYWCSGKTVNQLNNPGFTIPMTLTYSDGEYIITNTSSNRRGLQIIIQNIPV